MSRLVQRIKRQIRKSIIRDKALDGRVEAVSMKLWPWRETKLIWLVFVLVLLDFISTYAFLELSGNSLVYESGPLAKWALNEGGFLFLLLVDILAVSFLIGLAMFIRLIFRKRELTGYARAVFILILIPYTVVTFAIVFNNIVLTFI
jgi:hypothetical protein